MTHKNMDDIKKAFANAEKAGFDKESFRKNVKIQDDGQYKATPSKSKQGENERGRQIVQDRALGKSM